MQYGGEKSFFASSTFTPGKISRFSEQDFVSRRPTMDVDTSGKSTSANMHFF
jgi:hypothetical protein